MNNLWYTGEDFFVEKPALKPKGPCHLFVGFIDQKNCVYAPKSQKGKFMLFDSDNLYRNKLNALRYARKMNALPGILLNAIGLPPDTFVVVAMAGTKFMTLGKVENVVPVNHVLAVNTFNPRNYEFVAIASIGTAAKHIMLSALDAVQKLYECHDLTAEQFVLSGTDTAYEESTRFATQIGRIIFRHQV
tara:strand:- start:16 stop:582 length:567 start_codon:yes stop_codon:yes gene_type:complete